MKFGPETERDSRGIPLALARGIRAGMSRAQKQAVIRGNLQAVQNAALSPETRLLLKQLDRELHLERLRFAA